jgi:hypothetical protein
MHCPLWIPPRAIEAKLVLETRRVSAEEVFEIGFTDPSTADPLAGGFFFLFFCIREFEAHPANGIIREYFKRILQSLIRNMIFLKRSSVLASGL